MTDYTQTIDFSAKDTLPSGDSNKIIRGSDFDTEFDAIRTAVNSKANASSPTLTGTATAVNLTVSGTLNASGTLQIGGAAVTSTAAELNILDGVTANTAELNILDGVTASTAELNILDGVTATTAELNYVDGVTSNIQDQLDTKAPVASPTFTGTATIPTADINGGTIDGATIGGTTPAAGNFTSVVASGNVTGANLNVSNWDTAYGWGDHATQGYLTSVAFADLTSTPTTLSGYGITDGVTLTGTETLTNKTLTAAVLNGGYSEETFTLTGTTPALDPANGTIQEWTLTANSTPTDSLADGESMTLLIDDGTGYTITWPTMEWVGGSAPTLDATNTTVVVLFRVGTTLIGLSPGAAS